MTAQSGSAVVDPGVCLAVSTEAGILDPVHARIEAYYTDRISHHGVGPRGVDWTCTATQELRFVQLLKLCDFGRPFSLNDVGCGYGGLVDFVARQFQKTEIDYLGLDLSPAMISRARRRNRGRQGCRFLVGCEIPRIADYTVASGVMNVMLDHPRLLWEEFVADTLRRMHASSRLGFAVNFMAEKPDGTTKGLYRVDPSHWTLFCQQTLGCRVEVVEGYGMREYTLLVGPRHEP